MPIFYGRLTPLHSMPQSTESSIADTRPPPRAVLLLLPLIWLVLFAIFASLGGGSGTTIGPAGAAMALVSGLPLAALYMAACLGLGRALLRAFGFRDPGSFSIAWGLGLAAMLFLSHLLGWLGAFTGDAGRWAALAVLLTPAMYGVVECAKVVIDLRAGQDQSRSATDQQRPVWNRLAASAPLLLFSPMLLVAACSPPGWLWESEFGGFDALSYHLQLPKEWLWAGRIEPLPHNVYSYLPGYVEAAFFHMGAAQEALSGGRGTAFIQGDGAALLACQFLHAGLTLLAAWLTGRSARSAWERLAPNRPEGRGLAAGIASSLFLATPWAVVCGSLAYNEMGVLACTAGAVCIALHRDLSPLRRWAFAGFLAGAACSCKPTALFLCVPVVGAILLATTPRRSIPALLAAGCAAGLVVLAPWLLRNTMAGGNPVFPFATGVFGTAHWTAEQSARWDASHKFAGSITDRIRLMLLPDTTDPAGARHRGMMHPQWGLAFPALAVFGVALLWLGQRRAAAWLMCIAAAQLLTWLFLTHVQSRFLLPLLPTAVVAAGLFAACRKPAAVLACIAVAVQGGFGVVNFASQRGGSPNALLLGGPGVLNGSEFRRLLLEAGPAERANLTEQLSPEAYCNLVVPEVARLGLLGDATPLYFDRQVRYATTYDANPLFNPGEAPPEYVLINFAELDRYRRSGTLDPRIDPEKVRAWMLTNTEAVRVWEQTGTVLVRVRAGAPAPEAAP